MTFAKDVSLDNAPSNNSMDVRAKQRLSFNGSSGTRSLRGGGFAPRHLNRSALLGYCLSRKPLPQAVGLNKG